MAHGTGADRQPPSRKRVERQRAAEEPLARYNAKRDFEITSEPAGRIAKRSRERQALTFVIQKHWASRLHYDFRLELDGVMVSWAVPKGPSYDPAVKQMAIHVEDHPLSYNTFEGTIPKGQYGAGTVIVWDRGTWEPVGDPHDGLKSGKLIFRLHGEKLAGLWELVRISKPGEVKQEQWLLLKKRGDAWARSSAEYDVIRALPDSVVAKPLGLVEEREPRGRAHPHQEDASIDLSAAVEGALPPKLQPQLATLATAVPPGEWIVENKFDGYRMLARIADRRWTLRPSNRGGGPSARSGPSVGRSPRWWSKLPFRNGRLMAMCAIRPSAACVRTRRRARSFVKLQLRMLGRPCLRQRGTDASGA